MKKTVLEAVASSTAHGISRAAVVRATPLKIMWILFFALCLALFLKGGINLVGKLVGNKLTKVYHLDEVPFEFPDLHFCPSNPYSGSYPYLLTESEAKNVNSEIAIVLDKYRKLYGAKKKSADAFFKAMYVQSSLPFHLFSRHMTLRMEQSIMKAVLVSNFQSFAINMETFHTPENLICFRAALTNDLKQRMMSINSVLEIWLSTDPYFSDFNFSGREISPMVDGTGESIPFIDWHPARIVEKLKVYGYNMLIVPPGVYPSLRFESSFYMAPGNAYSVKLQMEENACSEELHRTHCVDNNPLVPFRDPLTRHYAYFNYSNAACYYQRRNVRMVELFGCQMASNPSLWEFRQWPLCLNVSEITQEVLGRMRTMNRQVASGLEVDATEYCLKRVPCYYPKYAASYSFGKWPGAGSSTDHFFATSFSANETVAPALARLVAMAKQMQLGNHSTHTESLFRSYVSESMLSARISIASVISSQVMLTWSYSVTDFLADTGGLLGLYIGCSVLTLCEILELIYLLVEHAVKRRRRSGQPGAPSHGTDEGGGADLPAKNGGGGDDTEGGNSSL